MGRTWKKQHASLRLDRLVGQLKSSVYSCAATARLPLQAWELSGDSYATHPGDKPWISEMYGYSFGAAKANVWHTCHHTAMLYPGYDTPGGVGVGGWG